MVVKIWRIHVLKYCHFSPISAGWTVHGQSSLNQPANFENIGSPNLSKHRPSLPPLPIVFFALKSECEISPSRRHRRHASPAPMLIIMKLEIGRDTRTGVPAWVVCVWHWPRPRPVGCDAAEWEKCICMVSSKSWLLPEGNRGSNGDFFLPPSLARLTRERLNLFPISPPREPQRFGNWCLRSGRRGAA